MEEVSWTDHAVERAKTSPIRMSWARKLIDIANAYKLSTRREIDKFQKHGLNRDVAYKECILRLRYTVNTKTGKVITFTVVDNRGQVIREGEGFRRYNQ